MQVIEINSIECLYNLKYKYDTHNNIIIDTKKIKYTGTLRYAFKYALWALRVNGELEIFDEPFEDFGFSTKRIDFWQIKHEFFKSLKDDIKILELDDKKGYIKVKKIKESYINDGFSFGIVFSGNDSEKEQLTKSIQSIINNIDLSKYNYEILICGPSTFDSNTYISLFNNSNIRYLPFDFEENAKRFMITQKKSYIYDNCKYNIVSINHTRILYSNDFLLKTFDKKFDVFTPQVMVEKNKQTYKYLDFGLIGSYDITKKSPFKNLTGNMLDHNYLFLMRKRVPYIDGGLSIFNKNIIKTSPYSNYIAWGEAEDINTAKQLFLNGYLIDFFHEILFSSISIKTEVKNDSFYFFKNKIRNYLVQKGIM